MKKALIVSSIFVVIGFALIIVGFAFADFDMSVLDRTAMVNNTYIVNDPVTNVTIEKTDCNVRIALSEDGACKVVCRERIKMPHQVTVENGTLKVTENDNRMWYDHIGIFWEMPEMTVYLPKAEYDTLRVDCSVGNVVLDDGSLFQNVNLNLDTGDLKLDNMSLKNLTLSGSTGNIRLHSVTVAEKLEITKSTGKTELSNIQCQSLTVKSTTGKHILKNVVASGDVKLEATTGNISLENVDGAALSIQTTTGNVTGTVLSEKVFQAETETGKVSVPQTKSGGICHIKTTTGKIQLTIAVA